MPERHEKKKVTILEKKAATVEILKNQNNIEQYLPTRCMCLQPNQKVTISGIK